MAGGRRAREAAARTAPPVIAERRGGTLALTLNRPPLNILNLEALGRLGDLLDDAFSGAGETPRPAAVLLGATGDRAFCAGADVGDHRPAAAPEMLRQVHRVVRSLWSAPCVTVAAVKGLALGAGMELALCCDLVLAEEGASFGLPEVGVGSFPPVAAAVLPDRVGQGRAADLILTGRRIEAREAAALGLVSRLAGPGDLDGAVERLMDELARSSPAVLACAARAIRGQRFEEWSRRLERSESIYLKELLPLPDAAEGVEAFLEKRVPRWTSR